MRESTGPAVGVRGQGDLVVRSMYVREVRADSREADFTLSTDATDRFGEVVEQVWQLDNFLRNPVALYAHDSHDLPIGQWKSVGVVDGELRGTLVFASERANPKAEQVFQSVREGTLRAVSVGFYPHSTRWEMRGDRETLILSENELLEGSVTPIPANPEALQRMRQRAIRCTPEPEPEKEATAMPEATPTPTEAPAVAEPVAVEPVIAAAPEPAIASATDADHKALATAQALLAVADANAAVLTERLAAADKRVAELEEELIGKRLDDLVGKRMTPAQKPGLVALYRADRAEFEKAIAALPVLPMAATKTVLGADPTPPERTHVRDLNPGAALAEAVNRAVGR